MAISTNGKPGTARNETEERLLDVALTLFATKGFAATSVREIIAATGVTRPVLYYYCDSKQDLFERVVRWKHDDAYHELASTISATSGVADRLRAIIRGTFAFCAADPRVPQLMFQTAFGPVVSELADFLAYDVRHAFRDCGKGNAGSKRCWRTPRRRCQFARPVILQHHGLPRERSIAVTQPRTKAHASPGRRTRGRLSVRGRNRPAKDSANSRCRMTPFPIGTQVVTLKDVVGQNGRTLHPHGAVGVVVRTPSDLEHSYRVRFPDGVEEALKSGDLTTLAKFKEGDIGESGVILRRHDLFDNVIYQCIIGSHAYGLADSKSDVDRRGCYLPPAELHWSLYGVPEQLECHETQESYWELQKFLVLALKANPNVLECLYTPLVERTTPLADELLSMRSMFLSRLVYQTYNGYVMSQFKKMQADIRNQGQVKWKHVMHLIRLLISGIGVLRDGFVPVRVDQHREQLL
ncbi:MAG: nucleotidyltransferase domain-containing protein, partial [Planctomycetales bacterium]|nr:nucleotidyltransferase domain-containing protein [Planctomycetales bacterium]